MRTRSLTFRMRLTLAFGGITFAASAAIVALLYLFMRFVPTYMITSEREGGDSVAPLSPPSTPSPTRPFTGSSETLEITNVADILDTLLVAGLLIAVIVATIAGAVGWMMAGRALKPLQEIEAAARRAGEGALDHRIGITGPKDEISGLADTFDHTLDRLERAFTANERFAANAAHELRTPLAATRLVLDAARAHPTAYQQDDLVLQLTANNERSIDLVEALLTLTALDSTTEPAESLDLADVAADAIAARRATAVSPETQLASAPAILPRTLIALALGNIVSNSIVHNDDRGYVRVETGSETGASWVSVTNTGPRISDDEASRLTEPLYRGSRTAGGGHGLGLAMVRTIVERHGGSVTLTPRRDGGLTTLVRLPRS